ncbi:MAG: hypothetical protein AB8F78_08130 [Saprospiraceae bacterium]
MKTAFSLLLLSLFLVGCNPTPNKEARLRKLESEIVVANESVKNLETEVKTLQHENAKLVVRVKELEVQ